MPIWNRPVCSPSAKECGSYRHDSQIGTDGEFRYRMLCDRLKARPWRTGTPEQRDILADFWSGSRVLVTGGAGFLGSRVVEKLRRRHCEDIFAPRSREFDLRRTQDVVRLFELSRPSMVIHLAATVGGIGANEEN